MILEFVAKNLVKILAAAELEIKYKVKNADGVLADAEYKINLKY